MEADDLPGQLNTLAARVSALEAEVRALQDAAAVPGARMQSGPRLTPIATGATGATGAIESEIPVRTGWSAPSPAGPSIEAQIGSQLFNRVGIIAVLIAAAWFLKLAIDRGYLGPLARVLVGVLAGLVLIAGSEHFRARGYAAFSYSLKAVGGGVLFLSIWAAYALFDLLGLAAAALAMVLVTTGLGVLAWVQDSELLLAYALVGGFLSPLLLSNGRNHQASLFGYLLVMDASALVLVARKPWPRLALGLLAGTGAYALGWYLRWYSPQQFGETLAFAGATFLLFAAVPYVVRGRDESVRLWLPALTAVSAFTAVLLLFQGLVHGGGARAWAELLLAAVYYALAAIPPPEPHDPLATVHGVAANGLLLAGVSFAIHTYWRDAPGSGFAAQISYSAWFMALGAALLALGFLRSRAPLRWQGLVLVSLAAGKVFLVDMARLEQGYRVLSFLGLGLLLLAISFVYQRDLLGLRR